MSFALERKIYQYARAPMGWVNSSTYLAKLYEQTFRGLSCVFWYSDNLLIGSEDEETHLKDLDEVFRRVERANIRISLERSHLLCNGSIEVFGFRYNIEKSQLSPVSSAMDKIALFAVPTDRKGLKSFLGLALYYTHLAAGLHRHLAELYPLTSMTTTFKWLESHQIAFEGIQQCIKNTQGIYLINHDYRIHKLHLTSDAGPHSYGGVIWYAGEDDVIKPIYHYHMCLNEAQKKRAQFYKELGALATLLLKCSFILKGIHFYLATDCRSLVFGHQHRMDSDPICNHIEFINSHQFTIIWCSAKCKSLALPDRLSRIHNIASGKKNYLRVTDDLIPDLEKHPLWKPHIDKTMSKELFAETMGKYMKELEGEEVKTCLLYTSPSPRDS